MKINTYSSFILLLVLFYILPQTNINGQLLTVEGKKIINTSNNQEVILNAMNFGNWMVMEGYMMNSTNQATSQHEWKEKLSSLIGSSKTETFYNAWLSNYVTQKDIIEVKKWGFNAVRLPLHYEYFINLETPDVWNNQGFTILDSVLSWCAAANVYAIVDLHAAPGGQSNGDISDYDSTKPSLWESETNKTKTVSLWRKLSERYKDQEWIAGYDLINEPAWNLPNGTDLRNLYGRITDTIRLNNDNHILFIEGNWYSNDYTGLTPAWDQNMVYVFHKYWSDATTDDIKWITDFRETQNRPIWCGEHGENSNDHFTKIVETFNANGIGFSWWPMKKFESINDFADAKYPLGYTDLLNYLGGTNPSINSSIAFTTLMQLAENVKFENCKVQTEVLRSIFIQPGNRDTEPFSNNPIPGKIYTPNYDKGMNGYAYSDQSWENLRVTTNIYTAWNNGWVYRNNGVDIEATSDPSSNGYTVGWFNLGEWLKYTVDVNSVGTYSITFRVANGNSFNGTVQIQNDNGSEILATATIPPTGSWSSWRDVVVTGAFHKTGLQGIRMVNISGEFNVNSINFVYQNSTIPTVIPVVPSQKVVSFKGNNGQFVTFSGTNNLLTCTSSSQGANEEFILVDAGNGLVAIKAKNGKYVSLNGNDNKLYCNASEVGLNEKFNMRDLSGAVSIKGSNNLYISSVNGASTGMTCDRTTAQAWEFFNWTYLKNKDLVTSTKVETFSDEYKVFPNPAKKSINVSSLLNKNAKIIIYDMQGKSVINTVINSTTKNIDLNYLNSGIYLMIIEEPNKYFSIKFIKE